MELEQSVVQIEYPERVAWYERLIREWTGQDSRVMVAEDGQVAAWIVPYTSHVGVVHPAPTQVWSCTIEGALEQLANDVYVDVQADMALNQWYQQSCEIPMSLIVS